MLNLLPINRKQTLRRRYIMQQVRFLMGIAVVATSISVVMLFTSDWLLRRWLENITVATKTDIISTDERTVLQALVGDVTRLVNAAEPIIADQPLPLYDVSVLLGPTPTDITLHEYHVNYIDHELFLTGTAASRDALVAYQKLISGLPGVSAVYSPLNDLTSKDAIAFTIQASYETAPVENNQ